jgi:MYXO-CTERM domain-containing protein
MPAQLNRKSVLWFLFLFNLAVALVVGIAGHHLHIHGHTLHGTQQVMTAAGMGAVALGAGAGLLRRRPSQA